MKDQKRTKQELIEELIELRQRIAKLEASQDARRRAEETPGRQAKELAFLQATVLEIAAPHDLSVLLHTIVKCAVLLLNAMGGGLYLCNPDRREAHCVVSYNTPHDYKGTVLKYGEGAAGMVAQTGEPLIIDDYRKWSHRAAAYEKDQPFTAVLSVPMIWQSQVAGVIHVLHNVENRRFSQGDQELLTLFANHAAIAVENDRLYQQALKEISDRKQAEESLKTSGEKYKKLFDEALDGIVLADATTGLIVDCNNAMPAMIGRSKAELIGQSQKILHPYTTPDTMFSDTFKQHLTAKEGKILETQIVTKTGEIREVEIKANLIELGEKKILQGLFRDITERKRAEEALRESEERYRRLVENAPDVIYSLSAEDGTITLLNPAFEKITGWSRAEWLGKPFIPLVHPDDLTLAMRTYQQIQCGEALPPYELRILSKSGEYLTGEFTSIPHIEKAKVVGEFGFAQNITERKAAQEKLQESEQKFRELYDHAPVGYFEYDDQGRITNVNRTELEMLGYTAEEMIGQPVWRFIVEGEKARHQILAKLAGTLPHARGLERTYRRKDETLIICLIENRILRDIEGRITGIRSTMQDITERKRAEEALEKSQERFRTSVETLLEGFAILSAVRDRKGQMINFKYEYINESGCKMNQKPLKEHMGKTLLELFPTHKEIGLFDEYVRVIETGQPLTKEFLIYETVYGGGKRLRQAFDVRVTRLGDGIVTTWQDITDKKKGEELLRQSEERLRLLIENAKDVIIMVDLGGSILYYNGPSEFGVRAEEILGKNPFNIFEPVIAARLMNQLKRVIKEGGALTFENEIPWKGESFWFFNQMYPIRDEKGRIITVGLIARNITERKRAENREQLAHEVLNLLNRWEIPTNTIREILLLLKKKMDFEAVGIRLREGDDFPYFETNGFSEDFVQAERHLCAYDKEGKIARDGKGNPVLECMCGNILCGRADAALPFFTAGGSFWTNSTTDLLASTMEEDRQTRTRNRCNGEGYESVALIPLRSGDEIIGLLQLNDRRRNQLTPETIHFFEGVGASVGIALSRKQAEEVLRTEKQRFETLSESAPFGMVMIDQDGTFKYINPKFRELFGYDLDDVPNGKTWFRKAFPDPKYRHEVISTWVRDLESTKPGEKRPRIFTVTCKDGTEKIINFIPVQLGTGENLMAYEDITERKRAEEKLNEANARLQMLQQITASVHSTLNLEEVFRQITDSFVHSMGYNSAIIITRNNEKNRFEIKALSSKKWIITEVNKILGFTLINYSFPADPGLNAAVSAAMRGEIVVAKTAEEVLYPLINKLTCSMLQKLGGIKNYIVVPLQVEKEVVGGIIITSIREEASEEEFKIVKIFAQAASHAIQNANLHTLTQQAKEALWESEDRYRDLVEHSHDLICTHDLQGQILSVNRGALKILGYDQSSILNKNIRDILAPRVQDEFDSYLTTIKREGAASGLMMIRTITGEKRIWEYNNTLRREGVAVPIVRGMANDVTERKRVEGRLTKLNECLLKFKVDPIENINRLVALCGEQLRGTFTLYNRLKNGLLHSVGQWNTPPDFASVGKPDGRICYNLIQSGSSEVCVIRNLQQTTYAQTDPNVSCYNLKTFVGKTVSFGGNVVGSLCVVYQEDYIPSEDERKFLGIVASAIGVEEERKLAEEALKRKSEEQELLLDNIQTRVWYLKDAETYGAVNKAHAEFLGKNRDEVENKKLYDVFIKEEAEVCITGNNEVFTKKIQLHTEEWVTNAKGEKRLMAITKSPKLDENGNVEYNVEYIVCSAEDITERKQAEERILTYQEELRTLASELSLIEERERRRIAIDLHDHISQTLAIAKIKLGMTQESISSTDLNSQLDEIRKLVDQAIQYTRSLTFELSPPILYELGLEAAIEWLTEQIQEQYGIQIGFEDDQQPKPMGEEFRISLFKATRELLTNIVKHAQASKAKVSIWRENNNIQIRVEDDGVGFSSPEGLSKTKTGGFGLFNIRERMRYLGGGMDAKSEPGHGTRVTLSAPLEEKGNDQGRLTPDVNSGHETFSCCNLPCIKLPLIDSRG